MCLQTRNYVPKETSSSTTDIIVSKWTFWDAKLCISEMCFCLRIGLSPKSISIALETERMITKKKKPCYIVRLCGYLSKKGRERQHNSRNLTRNSPWNYEKLLKNILWFSIFLVSIRLDQCVRDFSQILAFSTTKNSSSKWEQMLRCFEIQILFIEKLMICTK